MALVFSRQKRIQRDLEAGLVFRWRGGNTGNSGGMVIAVLCSIALMAALFWGLGVSFSKTPPKKNTYANVLMLDEVSPDLALWIDQNSPFPVRWDPAEHPEIEARVTGFLETTLRSIHAPKANWLEMPELAKELTPMRLIEPKATELGALPIVEAPSQYNQITELSLSLQGHNGITKRLPSVLTLIQEEIPIDQFGAEIRFAVVVSPDGVVEECVPLEWSDEAFVHSLVNWLSLQQFQETQGASVQVGDVSVKVNVINHVRNQL